MEVLSGWLVFLKCLLTFQLMVTKSVEEMGKLYPDDLGEKVNNDIVLLTIV
jgi:hypothetical protein